MRDLYASLVSVDEGGTVAAFRIYVNPGIGLLWFGGLVAAIGGAVAAWPARRRAEAPIPAARAIEREPEEVRVGGGEPA
jgi:cytochrome c biogenesis factor